MSVNTWYQCIPTGVLENLIEKAVDDPYAPESYLFPEDEDEDFERPEPHLWTEKNWPFLLEVLTFGRWAEQPLLAEAIDGGIAWGRDESYGESHVRYFKAETVAEISTALAGVAWDELQASCDPATPNVAESLPDGGCPAEHFGHVWATFTNIRDFFAVATAQGYSVLVYLG